MKDKENKENKSFAPIVLIIVLLTVFSVSCCAVLGITHYKPEIFESGKDDITFSYTNTNTTSEPEPAAETTARLMCAGNNTIYNSVMRTAQNDAEGESKYDFSKIYGEVKGIINKSDVALINQQSIISANLPVSSYPSFCSPTAVGDALYDLGFRVINHANRNVWDKGESGARDTIDYWKSKAGAVLVGLYENETAMNTVKYSEVNGIKIAYVSVTESLGGKHIDATSDIKVISLDDKEKDRAEMLNDIKDRIKTAKEQADVVVAMIHFNDVKANDVSDSQSNTAHYLVSFGADVVIGTGVTRVQKIEEVERDDGEKAIIFYSLGNFVSAEEQKENMLGGIADIVFKKNNESGKTVVESAKFIPIVTYFESGFNNVRVLPLDKFTEEMQQMHGLRNRGFSSSYANEAFESIITPTYLENN